MTENEKKLEVEAEKTQKCKFCGETIKFDAIKCRFCNEFVDETKRPQVIKFNEGFFKYLGLVGVIICFSGFFLPSFSGIFEGWSLFDVVRKNPQFAAGAAYAFFLVLIIFLCFLTQSYLKSIVFSAIFLILTIGKSSEPDPFLGYGSPKGLGVAFLLIGSIIMILSSFSAYYHTKIKGS